MITAARLRRVDERRCSRWFLLAAWVVASGAFITQAFGRLNFDSHLQIVVNPTAFLHQLLHLWQPQGYFGSVGDQYIGYAFPMGPYFLVGHAIGMPMWLVERLWLGLLVTIAFWGIVRLAESLDVGSRATRLAAGAAYSLWPTFTILIGSTSAAILPAVLLPWALVPLIRGARGGSPIKAAALSGLAVVAMGGVNAANTLEVLLLPLLFLLTRQRSRRRTILAASWAVAVVLAVTWWLVPLLLQARYGFNFLPFIEQSQSITQTMSATEALRGAGNWVAYFSFGRPVLIAGHVLVSYPGAIVGSAVVAAIGLFGLARHDMPERRWLVLALGVAAVFVLSGYPGKLGGPFSSTVQSAFNGPLAPIRSLYKVQPIIAVVLVLGLAHALSPICLPRASPIRIWRLVPATGITLLSAAAISSLAIPIMSGRILQNGSFSALPGYWSAAATFLAHHSADGRALLVPASGDAEYTWGSSIDEPLAALASSNWAVLDRVPFGGAGTALLLSGIEQALDSGQPSPGLQDLLARAGIRYLVVRNDLDWRFTASVPPAQVNRTIDTLGLEQVATFGPLVPPSVVGPTIPSVVSGRHAVEMYDVGRPVTSVVALPTGTSVLVSGAPQSLLPLADAGTIQGRAAVMAGDVNNANFDPAIRATTDNLRRQNTTFGLVQDNQSFTYTATERAPPGSPTLNAKPSPPGAAPPGPAPHQLLPYSGVQHQTVATYRGAALPTASSYASWYQPLPEYAPYMAFDGNPDTAWVPAATFGSRGEWLQLDLDKPIQASTITVSLLRDFPNRPIASRLRVTTSHGSIISKVDPTSAPQHIRVPAGATTWIRITFDSVRGDRPSTLGTAGAGISEVSIPGVTVTRFMQPPQEPIGQNAGAAVFSFDADRVDPQDVLRKDPEDPLARLFSTSRPTSLTTSGTAQPAPGPVLDRLIGSMSARSPLQVSATSVWGGLPQFAPQNLVDGDSATTWVAGEANPTLTLSWPGSRTLDTLNLGFVPAIARPAVVHLSSASGDRVAQVPSDGVVKFAPLTTDTVQISFPAVTRPPGSSTFFPVGLSELDFPALDDYRVPPTPGQTPFQLPCGGGPTVVIDGHDYATSIQGTYADLVYLRPIQMTLCGPDVHLAAGQHELVVRDSSSSKVDHIDLFSGTPAPVDPGRTVAIQSWSSQRRVVQVGPGASSFLEIKEAYNAGWSAALGGRPLTPIRLDGWAQGFVIPPGQGGKVALTFGPDRVYRLGLVAGMAAVLILLAAALGATRGLGRGSSEAKPATGGRGWLAAGAATAGIYLVAGPMAAVLPPLVALRSWRPRILPWMAAAAMASAGALAAVEHGQFGGTGAFSVFAQASAVFAVAAVLAPAVRWPFSRRSPKERENEIPEEETQERSRR